MLRRPPRRSRRRTLTRICLLLMVTGCFISIEASALLRQHSIKRLLMPIEGVHRSELVDTFGAARDGGRRHEGIDIFAPCGTPVIAIADGAIKRGWHPRAGRYVRLETDSVRSFYYAHLEAWSARARDSDFVRRGEVIGYVGNSRNARSTRCHLHFEVRENDVAVNPFPLLTERRYRAGAAIAGGR